MAIIVNEKLAKRLAYEVDKQRATIDCINVGKDPHETSPEILHVYATDIELKLHPSGDGRVAIIVGPATKARAAALKAAIVSRRSQGQATALDDEIEDKLVDVTLDSSWTPTGE